VETELGALELEDVPLLEPESLLEPEPLRVLCALAVVVLVAVVVVAAAVVCVVVVLRDSTGSWPLASVTVISSQVATNSATAPPMIRRRIVLARSRRAAFSCAPLLCMPVASTAPLANS
jgi:hypothetical protein